MAELARRTMLKLLGLSTGAIGLSGTSVLGSRAGPDDTAAPPSTSTRTLSGKIADFIVGAKLEDLPQAVIEKAKEQLVYFFGRAFQSWFTATGAQVREMAQRDRLASGGATIVGNPNRVCAAQAAFANASLFYRDGLDDVIWPSGVHAGVIALPAALALGEIAHASGRDLLLAIVLGYEIPGKLGRAQDPWHAPLPRRGSTVFGGYCSVVAGGRALGLDRTRMSHALAYAATLCLGTAEGAVVQDYYSLISHSGTFAAQLAQAGAVANSTVTIEGELGLFRSFYGTVPAEVPRLVDSLGSGWEILTTVQKRYPGTSQNTSATELFLKMAREARLAADQVVRIDASLPYNPVAERQQSLSWRGPFGTRFQAPGSLPYALAIGLLDGRIDIARFDDERVNDPAVAAEMQKVNVAFERGHQGTWAKMRIHTRDGRTLEREVDHFVFEFPRPMWGEWLADSGRKLLPPGRLARLEQLIAELENLDDISKLLAAATPAQAGARA